MKYVVIYEPMPNNWSAYVPDLPGYAAGADTLDELRALVREGIPFHLEGLRLSGEPVPPPTIVSEQIDAA